MSIKRAAQQIASKRFIEIKAARYFIVGRHRYGSKFEPPQMLSVIRAGEQDLDIAQIKLDLEVEHGRAFYVDVYPASALAARRWYKLARNRASDVYKPDLDFVLLAKRTLDRTKGISNVTICTEIEVFYQAAAAELCATRAAFERAWQNTIIVPFQNFKQVLMSTAYQLVDGARHIVELVSTMAAKSQQRGIATKPGIPARPAPRARAPAPRFGP